MTQTVYKEEAQLFDVEITFAQTHGNITKFEVVYLSFFTTESNVKFKCHFQVVDMNQILYG